MCNFVFKPLQKLKHFRSEEKIVYRYACGLHYICTQMVCYSSRVYIIYTSVCIYIHIYYMYPRKLKMRYRYRAVAFALLVTARLIITGSLQVYNIFSSPKTFSSVASLRVENSHGAVIDFINHVQKFSFYRRGEKILLCYIKIFPSIYTTNLGCN